MIHGWPDGGFVKLTYNLFVATAPTERACDKSREVTSGEVQASSMILVSIALAHRSTNGNESSFLATLIGTLVRTHAPFDIAT